MENSIGFLKKNRIILSSNLISHWTYTLKNGKLNLNNVFVHAYSQSDKQKDYHAYI